MTCTHERLMIVSGKVSDAQSMSVPHLSLEDEGGTVYFGDVYGGDYIDLRVCLDCCKLVNFKPYTDGEVKAIFGAP